MEASVKVVLAFLALLHVMSAMSAFPIEPSGPECGGSQLLFPLADAASVILVSMALLAMGLFGSGIAAGIVSGAPQLGAGAAVDTMAAVGAGALHDDEEVEKNRKPVLVLDVFR